MSKCKHMLLTLAFCILIVCAFSSVAQEKYEFETEQQRQDFLELNKELRCPKCQNQNIADSNALISTDMKRKVHELIQEGKNKQEVVEFMKVRYGEFVHYKPPMTPLTLWLYLGPALFIVLAVSFFFYNNRSRLRKLETSESEASPAQYSSQKSRLEQAEKALKELE